jgi:glycosyltransferase involved in cell wall biosynthesis
MRLSVIIPVFDRQRALDRALASLAHDAALIAEVVVVDDGSPTPMRLVVPTPLAGRVRLLRLAANAGAAAARQAGVEASSGELVGFLDSDDAWLPGKLAPQIARFGSAREMLAVATGWQVVDRARRRCWAQVPIASARAADFAAGCWFCPGSTVVITRHALTAVGPFDTTMKRLEDVDWYLRFACAGGRLEVVESVAVLIGRSAPARLALVEQGARIVAAKRYVAPDRPEAAAIEANRRAFLDLVRASAARGEGRRLLMAGYLARSFWHRPRARLQLRPWWRAAEPALSCEAALAVLGGEAG